VHGPLHPLASGHAVSPLCCCYQSNSVSMTSRTGCALSSGR
jgi:hypothetical protein